MQYRSNKREKQILIKINHIFLRFILNTIDYQ